MRPLGGLFHRDHVRRLREALPLNLDAMPQARKYRLLITSCIFRLHLEYHLGAALCAGMLRKKKDAGL